MACRFSSYLLSLRLSTEFSGEITGETGLRDIGTLEGIGAVLTFVRAAEVERADGGCSVELRDDRADIDERTDEGCSTKFMDDRPTIKERADKGSSMGLVA